MTRAISILNFKGGTGKSTLALNLAHALALQEYRVLVIDCDMQANSSTLLAERSHPTLTDVLWARAPLEQAIQQARVHLFIVPSDSELDTAAGYLHGKRQAYYILRNAVKQLHDYDFILFDHAPSYSPITEAALLASSEMLIPCELVPYAVQGLYQMFNKLQENLGDHELAITGIVPFNVDFRYSMSTQYLTELQEKFHDLVLHAVRTDATVTRAQSLQQTVFEYDPKSKVAEDFSILAESIQKRGTHE